MDPSFNSGYDADDEGDAEAGVDYSPISVIQAAGIQSGGEFSSEAEESPLDRSLPPMWTAEAEMTILRGLLDFKKQRSKSPSASEHAGESLYEHMKNRLGLNFTEFEINGRLFRLKDTYRTSLNRLTPIDAFIFKNDHDKKCFEICREIWGAGTEAVVVSAGGSRRKESRAAGSSRSRTRSAEGEQPPVSFATPNITEKTEKGSLMENFTELVQFAMAGILVDEFANDVGSGTLGTDMKTMPYEIGTSHWNLPADENWKNRPVSELEGYLKQMELMRDQVQSTLEELKSGSASSVS